MEFMLWAALSLHIFSVIIWLGSLCFLSAVLYPVLAVEKQSGSDLAEHFHRRMMPFLWLSLWTIGITGAALYIFIPDFLYGREEVALLSPVHGKIVSFIIVIIFSIKIRKMYEAYKGANTERSQLLQNMAGTIRITILFGILSLLFAAWESISKITS